MKLKNQYHYKKLLDIQKLLKSCDENKLMSLKSEIAQLEEENNILSLMLQKGSYADFIDPLLICQKMERNHRLSARMDTAIQAQIQIWARSNRRVDHITEKLRQAKLQEMFSDLTELLNETISRNFYAHKVNARENSKQDKCKKDERKQKDSIL